jgi:hypothetical protein
MEGRDMAGAVTPGAAWRVKAEHPDRPGTGPLRVYAKDRTLIASAGEVCTRVSAEHLASMIACGYVEPVTDKEPA